MKFSEKRSPIPDAAPVDIAVLFVDIRGFTTMSEVLTPEEVVAILNRYLDLTTNAIFKNNTLNEIKNLMLEINYEEFKDFK